MAKPRTLANTVSNGGPLADGAIGVSEVAGLQDALDAKAEESQLPSSTVVGTDDVQTLSNKTIASPTSTGDIYNNGSIRGNLVSVAALNIDCSLGNYFLKSISANSTFTFSNAPASRAYAFTLEVIHTSGTITWPASVRWPNNTAPSLTTSRTHLFTFVTDDGGTSWRGVANVNYTS